jgi:hypothetical protein
VIRWRIFKVCAVRRGKCAKKQGWSGTSQPQGRMA